MGLIIKTGINIEGEIKYDLYCRLLFSKIENNNLYTKNYIYDNKDSVDYGKEKLNISLIDDLVIPYTDNNDIDFNNIMENYYIQELLNIDIITEKD